MNKNKNFDGKDMGCDIATPAEHQSGNMALPEKTHLNVNSIVFDTSNTFINADQLQALLSCHDSESKLRVVDATVKSDGDAYKDFASLKIPQARYLDLTIVRDASKPYPFMVPTQEHFVRMMKMLDLAKSHVIIVYDSGKGFHAAKTVHMMRAFGHPRVF